MRRWHALTALAVLLVLACVLPTEACSCPPVLGLVNLVGTVTRAGQPLPQAPLRIEIFLYGCGSSPRNMDAFVDDPRQRADATGQYAILARAVGVSDTACIRVSAFDTVGGRRDSTTATVDGVRLVAGHGTREQPATVRLDLRF